MKKMPGLRRHGFSSVSGDKERVRTHMMFSGEAGDHTQKRRTRRKRNKLHARAHQHDAIVQTAPTEMDPAEWTGNQRIVHFGPMAQRDPYFYYYPKGWDILYPAYFGFFPYRTKNFRGSSPTVCLTAFGVFIVLGGAAMTYLAYFVLYPLPWSNSAGLDVAAIPPLQVAGPIFLLLGCLCLLCGCMWWLCSLQLCNEHLRHSQPHHVPPRRTVRTHRYLKSVPKVDFSEKGPHRPPPPPCYPVLVNAYTEPSLYTPESEMKLYPPVMPGYSTLSLPHSYIGSPYNTLSARPEPDAGSPILENIMDPYWPEYHASRMSQPHFFPQSTKRHI